MAFSSQKALKTVIFGNFVMIFKPVLCKIGNFVIKNVRFDPFLALAKNLTKASCPSEMRGQRKQKFWIASFLAMTQSDKQLND